MGRPKEFEGVESGPKLAVFGSTVLMYARSDRLQGKENKNGPQRKRKDAACTAGRAFTSRVYGNTKNRARSKPLPLLTLTRSSPPCGPTKLGTSSGQSRVACLVEGDARESATINCGCANDGSAARPAGACPRPRASATRSLV